MSVYMFYDRVLVDSAGLVAIDARCCDCPGSCCVGGECSVVSLADCDLAGGLFFGDPTCDPNPCVLCTGYCCVPHWTPRCGAPTFGSDCVNAGYYFGGCGSTCCGGNTCYCPVHPTGDMIQVALSGTYPCPCVNDGFSDSRKWVGSFGGTYNLQKVYSCGEQYLYRSTSPVMQQYYYHGNFTCTGTPDIGDLYLELSFICGNANGEVCLATPAGPDGGGGYAYGCAVQPSPIYSGTSFSLGLGSCGGWNNPLGGTAVMVVTYSPPEF